jgi:propionyl-CoA synthetase
MESSSPDNTFDLIILGAGTAGSLLASRLSASTNLSILILESGENHNKDPNVTCPGYSRRLLGNPKYDWQFQTQPEEGLNGRVIQQPRGRLWGGSSAINSHALVYPSQKWQDGWDALLTLGGGKEGSERWDWEGVGKYYSSFQELQGPSESVRKELSIGDFAREDGGEKSESGGIKASYPVTPHLFHKIWVDAMKEYGYDSSKDPREGDVIGGYITTNAIDSVKGERSHAGVEFLEPAAKRDNLVVRSGALVEKIVFDREKKDGKLVATGVRYLDEESGAKVTVHARKEVIICAGTFGSPKILELSGIGKREVLSAAGIDCLYDLPGVGGKYYISGGMMKSN